MEWSTACEWFVVARTGIIYPAMAALKLMLSEFRWNDRYRISGAEDALTPALVLYPDIVASNIACTVRLLGGDATRWRAHIKTAKIGYTLRMLVERGVRNFKCATTLELKTACENGAEDVLVAYPVMGANARRVREIADQFPHVRISALAENKEQVRQWQGSRAGVFLDINPGMNRTGLEAKDGEELLALVREINAAKLEFRGLHYYDGQFGGMEEAERTAAAHAGYDRLMELVAELRRRGTRIPEVITAGTPTLPSSLSYERFRNGEFIHRVSPGTVVYCDATCLAQLSPDYGYAPAVIVMAQVVSHPHDDIITCDGGHKAVSADAGVPTCVVMGYPGLEPLSPSEEHLPIRTAGAVRTPGVGETIMLIPRHVCPTVNNFDSAVLVRDGRIEAVEKVSARGHEELLPRVPTTSK